MILVQNTIFNGIKIVLFYAFIGLLVGKLIAYVNIFGTSQNAPKICTLFMAMYGLYAYRNKKK